MKPREIAEKLLRLAKGAAPGPWSLQKSRFGPKQPNRVNGPAFTSYRDSSGRVSFGFRETSDAEYIASCSPDTITLLCSTLLRYEEALRKISTDEWEVISQSTGLSQHGPSISAVVAQEAL